MASALTVLGFLGVIALGAVLELVIERLLGADDDMEIILRRRSAPREVR